MAVDGEPGVEVFADFEDVVLAEPTDGDLSIMEFDAFSDNPGSAHTTYILFPVYYECSHVLPKW